MLKNLLYIGNKLNRKSSNPTTMQVLGDNLTKEGYDVTYSSSKTNKILRMMDMLMSVIKNRKSTNYVLIDTYSTQNFFYAYAVSKLCQWFKLKYIPILHGGNLPNRLKNSPKLSRSIFDKAYQIVSPSVYLKEQFDQFGYKNLLFIPNTIEIENYPFSKKSIDKPRIFWLRSFRSIYNPRMALKVASILKEKDVDFNMCMVGPDGDGLLSELKLLANKQSLNIEFKGKLSKPEWIELSKSYNIFINTTNFDNLPVSILEAMALGFPIVSTNVGGLPYLIEDGKDGLLVNAQDAEQMANKIIGLIDNHELVKKLSTNAREKALKYDWKTIGNQWKTLLKIPEN